MSSEDPETVKAETPPEREKGQLLDPTKADRTAENEFKQKYGIKKAPPGMAQRKISATGGKQYFDSGDYNRSANRQDRQAIASHPHAMNPHLAQMRAKAVVRSQPSKLVAGNPRSPTKSPLAS